MLATKAQELLLIGAPLCLLTLYVRQALLFKRANWKWNWGRSRAPELLGIGDGPEIEPVCLAGATASERPLA